jgi:hypothetical protein
VRWTEEQFADVLAKRHMTPAAPSKPTKYRNVPTTVDGRRFASKLEARRYQELMLAKAVGQIRGFACQVSIPLPSGKRRMVLDFLVVNLDGSIRFLDAKGVPTPAWSTKRDELEHALGIKIELV